MFKVVLWDYTGESENWAKNLLKSGVEIIRTLRPNDADQAEVIMRGNWNFVLIFEKGGREIFDEILKTMQAMNFSTDNIVFANDFNSWLNNPAAVYALLKPEACDNLYRHWTFFKHGRWNRYVSTSVEGIHYVATSIDYCIIRKMYINNQTWAEEEMKIFYALTKKYYNVNDSTGYFLELGANIGTTGFYFLEKFAPNLKYLAFEPDAENFKMLRINSILNDLEDKSILVNFGLGEKFDEMTMYRIVDNPGGNRLFRTYDNCLPEKIKIIPLDSYLAENKIAAQDVKYIWIDTEGYEAQVLLGAKNLISENPAPIFMECNLKTWKESGLFEDIMTLLSKNYSHFFLITNGKKILYPLEALRTIEHANNPLGQIGDIFLIKGGAVN